MEILYVWAPPHLIGELRRNKNDDLSFQYSQSWIQNPNNFALSLSLKLKAEIIYTKEAEFFFANLLPEGNARESLCRKLGISITNDFELLKKIGRDCAGAIVLTDENELTKEPAGLKELPKSDLENWLKQGSSGLLDLQVSGELRLSLAGAQDKLPLVYLNDTFYQPLGSHPTTHILKPAPQKFKYLPENEYFQSRLAEKIGLPVPPSKLVKFGSHSTLLITRYDRHLSNNTWTRLHQEDFCQALGVSGRIKYQSERGPSFLDCINIINERSTNPSSDLDLLIKWQMFNVLIGNCDAHAKNISLLRSHNGQWGLAPFYDLVSTAIYPQISQKLAMSIGDQFDSQGVYLKHWLILFKQCEVSSSAYSKLLHDLVTQLPDQISKTKADFISEFGTSPVLNKLEKIYRSHLKRITSDFKDVNAF